MMRNLIIIHSLYKLLSYYNSIGIGTYPITRFYLKCLWNITYILLLLSHTATCILSHSVQSEIVSLII